MLTVDRPAGFAKALKKFEKATKVPCAAAYGSKVDKAAFVSSARLDELITETENAFASVFEHGDRKKACVPEAPELSSGMS